MPNLSAEVRMRDRYWSPRVVTKQMFCIVLLRFIFVQVPWFLFELWT